MTVPKEENNTMDTASLEIDQEAEALRDMGRAQDMNEGRPAQTDQSAEKPEVRAPGEAEQEQEREPQPPETGEPEQKPDTSDIESSKQKEQARDAGTGRFEKGGAEDSRAAKEEARKERSWQALQAQKEAFRQQQAQWEEQIRVQQLEAGLRNNAPLKKDGLTMTEYFEGAQRLKAAGDYQNAIRAWETGLELQQAEAQRWQQNQAAQLEYNWRVQMEHAIKQNPEIVNPESKVMQLVDAIVAARPGFYYMPDGFAIVATIADMAARLESMSEVQNENEQLHAELEKRYGRSQPLDGRVTGSPRGEKPFDDMDLNEMENHLKRVTAEADNYR